MPRQTPISAARRTAFQINKETGAKSSAPFGGRAAEAVARPAKLRALSLHVGLLPLSDAIGTGSREKWNLEFL